MKKLKTKARKRTRGGNPAKRKLKYATCPGCNKRLLEEHFSGHKEWCSKFKSRKRQRPQQTVTLESMSRLLDTMGTGRFPGYGGEFVLERFEEPPMPPISVSAPRPWNGHPRAPKPEK